MKKLDAKKQALVSESCDNAVANGYELWLWTAEDIAIDMGTTDPQFDGEEPEELIPYVEVWLKEKAPSTHK